MKYLLRNQALRNLIPARIKALYAEHVYVLRRVRSRSEASNVYH